MSFTHLDFRDNKILCFVLFVYTIYIYTWDICVDKSNHIQLLLIVSLYIFRLEIKKTLFLLNT